MKRTARNLLPDRLAQQRGYMSERYRFAIDSKRCVRCLADARTLNGRTFRMCESCASVDRDRMRELRATVVETQG